MSSSWECADWSLESGASTMLLDAPAQGSKSFVVQHHRLLPSTLLEIARDPVSGDSGCWKTLSGPCPSSCFDHDSPNKPINRKSAFRDPSTSTPGASWAHLHASWPGRSWASVKRLNGWGNGRTLATSNGKFNWHWEFQQQKRLFFNGQTEGKPTARKKYGLKQRNSSNHISCSNCLVSSCSWQAEWNFVTVGFVIVYTSSKLN